MINSIESNRAPPKPRRSLRCHEAAQRVRRAARTILPAGNAQTRGAAPALLRSPFSSRWGLRALSSSASFALGTSLSLFTAATHAGLDLWTRKRWPADLIESIDVTSPTRLYHNLHSTSQAGRLRRRGGVAGRVSQSQHHTGISPSAMAPLFNVRVSGRPCLACGWVGVPGWPATMYIHGCTRRSTKIDLPTTHPTGRRTGSTDPPISHIAHLSIPTLCL